MDISTITNPIKFFEITLSEESKIRDIANNILECSPYISYKFKENSTVVYCIEIDDETGEAKEYIEYTKDLIIEYLKKQYYTSREYLYQFCIRNDNTAIKSYLSIQVKAIQLLINKSKDLLAYHPYFLIPLKGLVKYINELLLIPGMDEFIIDVDIVKIIPLRSNLDFDAINSEKVYSILKFMAGKNEKQETILSQDDFNRLIDYTNYLVENEEVPEIESQLEPKITFELLRFTYWVLHKELYTTKRIKPCFYNFVKDMFVQSNNSQLSSIKKMFAVQARIARDSFIPNVISKYFRD
ncbi:hypothetical protein [Winogradskyella luteola]|uniref:Uncharacterized protein n=1 Tax=Winogradskyella luteola TaxID=2828330 RepID=A0A9X1FAM6_9FLAO|nr:hypothetical protein [Winogradskyella luteola]MBV7270141.1 hypothetical protein [Winogradskyella luteola]